MVHSVKGQSRSCTVLASFFMRKYRWSLLKTLEFINSRRPDLEIRPSFIHQLSAYENRLVTKGLGPKTSKWTEVNDATNEFENEELLLRNTYLNAQMGPFADLTVVGNKEKITKLKWTDISSNNKVNLVTVIGFAAAAEDIPSVDPKLDMKNVHPLPGSRNAVKIVGCASATNQENPLEPKQQLSARDDKDLPPGNQITDQQNKKELIIKQSQNFALMSQPKEPIILKSENIKLEKKSKGNEENKGIKKHLVKFAENKPEIIKKTNAEEPKFLRIDKHFQKIGGQKNMLDALLRPKINNYTKESKNSNETPAEAIIKPIVVKADDKKKLVANIINQNNINNFFIQNPEKVELIEITGSQPQGQSIVKKIVSAKKKAQRSSSAAIRRESPKPRTAESNERREVQKGDIQTRDKKYLVYLVV